ncbi:hypothetical protein PCC7424_2035 [Gloeothece citriformis PCC 7424]|uniref:Uncharacterized protein n=1 Tax=Gloeothece citriformis (strain PCC 7424) TaxID=65393 RepID=B7KF09_GLOC7|nr:hypothetical protein [Gloeothece citriformis]ACK70465.1 hypothetical protein PCC7424_2035 [Gloeothece citriformis PCC 7424]
MDIFNEQISSKQNKPTKQEARQPLYSTVVSEERVLVLLDEIDLLREQIETWRNFVDTQNQELQAIEQELKQTNQELCDAFNFQHHSLTEVKNIANIILKSKKPASECLAELISILYECPVKSQITRVISPL